jgi:hypothetical protein
MSEIWPDIVPDPTLPEDHVKILYGETAVVYRADYEAETLVAVASWPEIPVKNHRQLGPKNAAP